MNRHYSVAYYEYIHIVYIHILYSNKGNIEVYTSYRPT